MFSYKRLFFVLLLLGTSHLALAQEVQDEAASAEAVEVIDEVDQPAITIRKPEVTDEISETREGGETTEIKVKSGPSTYYLYPSGARHAAPSVHERGTMRPAMWKVYQFDIGEADQDKRTKKQESKMDPLNVPALPPPSMDK